MFPRYYLFNQYFNIQISKCPFRRAGSDSSMSASGSADPGFDPRRGSKFSTSGLEGVEM